MLLLLQLKLLSMTRDCSGKAFNSPIVDSSDHRISVSCHKVSSKIGFKSVQRLMTLCLGPCKDSRLVDTMLEESEVLVFEFEGKKREASNELKRELTCSPVLSLCRLTG